jgi:hypothetical protein
VPIVQISRIQHRRGKRTDLPQLAAGELGWVIDEQRLFIGNGTVADGAPAVGNTEIVTSGSSAFTTALNHTYQGYLGNATPISTSQQRSVASKLDEVVSVRDFGAKGDDSTADLTAIQNAIDEIYRDPDKTDTRSRRILFFPAGTYRINASMTIPPYAHLVGEGPDKTIIRNSGNNPVAVTEDTAGNVYGAITSAPTQIQISNITFKNTTANGGVSIDNATKIYFHNCKFEGNYTAGGADVSASKGITVRSTSALPCANIYFNHCQFTTFARLVDLSYDVKNVRFNDCDFNTAYYGAMIGESMDGSSAGLINGPRDVQFTSSTWDTISQQAIFVKPTAGADAGVGPRNIISNANWYGKEVGNNNEGIGSLNEVPVLQFDNDECTSMLDFFERSELRRTDGSSHMNAAPELQGIGIQTKPVRQFTMLNDTSTAATINEFPGLNKKGFSIKYKIERGSDTRTGEMIISADPVNISYSDDFSDSNEDVGVTLSAVLDNKDSTSGNETIKLQYTMTDSSNTNATFDYQVTILA